MKFHPVFGLLAPELGWAPSPSYLMRRDRILRRLADARSETILEVGCGAGALACELARQGHSVTAVESSPAALATARALTRAACAGVQVVDRPQAGWSQRFSLLFAFEVLEHIEDDLAALSEWASWIAPGGALMLSVPAHRSQWNAGDEWAGHFRRYDRADLESVVRAAGLTIESIETWGFPLANVMQPFSSMVYRSRLKRRSNSSSKAEATAASGVERRLQVKLHWLLINPASAALFRAVFWIQGLFSQTPLGVGYLVVASTSKPPIQRPVGRG